MNWTFYSVKSLNCPPGSLAPEYHFFSFLTQPPSLTLPFLLFNYLDSSSIFIDGQFEEVSKAKIALCWNYFLLDKTNDKAKCKVKISEGEYCDRVYSAKGGSTTALNTHLRKQHGITK